MTSQTPQQPLANALYGSATRIVAVSLGLVFLVSGMLSYYRVTTLRLAQSPAIQLTAQADGSSGRAVGASELAYVSAFMSEEQLQRYLDGRQDGFQAGGSTCSPVGPDELQYVGTLLNDAQLQRYLDGRQCPRA
jgi:hypothetical protein